MWVTVWLHRLRRGASRQSPIFWLFLFSLLCGVLVLTSSLLWARPAFSLTDQVALSVGLLGAAVVWWQGHLIARQIVLGTVVDLYREWNSPEMLAKRKEAWHGEDPDPETIEDVLEFLEKVSTLAKNRFVTQQLVWDTFGWYIGRYYFYSRPLIDRFRSKWTPQGDPTLYQDLEKFYPELVRLEVEQRNEKRKPGSEPLARPDIEEEYRQTRNMFIESEAGEIVP